MVIAQQLAALRLAKPITLTIVTMATRPIPTTVMTIAITTDMAQQDITGAMVRMAMAIGSAAPWWFADMNTSREARMRCLRHRITLGIAP